MDKWICSECGTENEKEYVYCKNCGAKSVSEQESRADKTDYGFKNNPNFTHNENFYNTPNGENPNFSHQGSPFVNNGYNSQYQGFESAEEPQTESIGGIPTDEMALFIGNKANKILPKFAKMELTGTKTSWCWPAAVLGFFFGPMGSALWFFYRKMYRAALILLAVGAALSISLTVFTHSTAADRLNSFFGAFEIKNSPYISENSESKAEAAERLAVDIEKIVNFASCIVTGLFGFYLYKKHAVKKIKGYREYNSDPRYYRLGLTAVGGTSGGMAVLGIAAFMLVQSVSGFIILGVSSIKL